MICASGHIESRILQQYLELLSRWHHDRLRMIGHRSPRRRLRSNINECSRNCRTSKHLNAPQGRNPMPTSEMSSGCRLDNWCTRSWLEGCCRRRGFRNNCRCSRHRTNMMRLAASPDPPLCHFQGVIRHQGHFPTNQLLLTQPTVLPSAPSSFTTTSPVHIPATHPAAHQKYLNRSSRVQYQLA